MKIHKLNRTSSEDEMGYETWECNDCPEKRRVRWRPWHILRMLRGDSEAKHVGNVGGTDITKYTKK